MNNKEQDDYDALLIIEYKLFGKILLSRKVWKCRLPSFIKPNDATQILKQWQEGNK